MVGFPLGDVDSFAFAAHLVKSRDPRRKSSLCAAHNAPVWKPMQDAGRLDEVREGGAKAHREAGDTCRIFCLVCVERGAGSRERERGVERNFVAVSSGSRSLLFVHLLWVIFLCW